MSEPYLDAPAQMVCLPRSVVEALVPPLQDRMVMRDGYWECRYCGDAQVWTEEYEELIEHQDDCPIRIVQEALRQTDTTPGGYCSACGGTGRIAEPQKILSPGVASMVLVDDDCPVCGGTGRR